MRKYTGYGQYYEAQKSRATFSDNVRRQQAITRGLAIDLQAYKPDNDASIVSVLAEGAVLTTNAELSEYLGILPPSAPDTPFMLTAIPSDSTLQISFSGGSNATNFLYSTDGSTYTPFNPPYLFSPVTLTGLTNGVTYSVSLKAINDIGLSLASSPVLATPLSLPQPPRLLSLSVADSAFYIYFIEGSNGGSPITNYEISINGVTFSPLSPESTSSPLFIGGFANGATYTLYFRSINHLGSSLTSTSIIGTPGTTPLEPTSLVLTPANTSMSIAFTPGYDGGAYISNYEYSSNGSPYTPFSPAQTGSPVLFSNLTNGVSYSISLKAVNEFGSSPASSTVTGIPARYPDPPTSLVATSSNSSIGISFVAGATNGTPIINYKYSIDGSNFTPFSPAVTASPVRISGLSNGTLYTVYLEAVNSIGSSYPSAPVTATPATVPSPPTSLVATPSNMSISISFSNGDTGGNPLSNYKYSTDGTIYTLFSPAQTTSPVLVTGLSNGSLYTVYLQAVNGVGSSTPAGPVSANPVTFPSPPTSLVATPSNTSISISFSNADTGGRAISNYEYSTDGSNYTLFSPAVTTSPVLITGLSNGTSYTVYLQAVTSFGSSTPAGPVSANPVTLPSPPTSLVATPSNTSISISFSNGDTGGRDITGYKYSLNGTVFSLLPPDQTTSPVLITGLNNGTSYTVYLQTVTSFGSSVRSESVTANPVTFPSPPTSLVATPSNTSISISFSAESPGGRNITNYQYSLDGTNYTLFTPSRTMSPVLVTGLTNGTSYTVYLQAVTSFGPSIAAGPVTATPVTLPSPPTSLVATPSNSQLSIAFSEGDTGGRNITNYKYSTDGTIYTLFSPAQTTSPAILTGLSNGTSYTVYLQAVTSFGTSIASGSVSATPARVPDAPTSLVAIASNVSFQIYFSNGYSGGSPITNYQYSIDGNNYTPFNPAQTTSPVIVTGLTNGISYTVSLAAINSMGEGAAASVTQTPIPPDVPGPPTGFSIIPGDSSVTIPFTAGSNGRSPITNYSYSIDGSTFIPFSPEQITSPLLISGLSNGVDYTLYLKAINEVGSSITSSSITYSPIPSSFVPTSITGANLWLDSLAASSVIVSGSNVTAWNDTSGIGNHFTASGGTITYGGTAQINQRPAINFTTGSPTVTRLSRTFQISSSAAVISLFMVIQQTGISLAGSNSFIFTNNIAQVNSISVLTLASTSNLNVNVGGSVRDTTTNIINSPVFVSVIIGRSPNAIYINGTIPSVSASNFGSGSILLNNSATWSISGSSFLGYIGEIISYPTALSIENQQKVESYLGWKWGIQSNLNSSSIWKYTPPTGDTVPGAPTVIYVLAGISNAYVFFTPGSGTVIGYQYTLNNGTSYTTLNPPQTTSPLYISTVLTNTIYLNANSFLRAFNGGGFSTAARSANHFYNSNLTFQTPVYLIDPTNATCYSGSGTSITNIGSAGGSGTLTGSISYGIGSNLSRNVFNFTGGFMNIVPSSTSSGNFAISAWIYPSTTTDSKNNFIIGGSGYSFGWSNSSLIFQTYLSGFATPIPYYSSSMSNIIVANTWQHISAMFLTNGGGVGGSNLVLFFLNGVQVTTTENIIVPLNTLVVFASSRFYVGSALSNVLVPSSMSNIMNGQLGSLKVWTNTSSGGNSTLSYFVNEFNATRANFGV